MKEIIDRLWKLERMLRNYDILNSLEDFKACKEKSELYPLRSALETAIKELEHREEEKLDG